MNLKMLIAVSGKQSGLYKLVTSRKEGIVADNLLTQKREYVAQRGSQFTLLESISIYTQDDNVLLSVVFDAIKASESPLPSPKDSDAVLRAYFTEILPDHDQNRVYISDIRKVVKWYATLLALNMLEDDAPETTEAIVAEDGAAA